MARGGSRPNTGGARPGAGRPRKLPRLLAPDAPSCPDVPSCEVLGAGGDRPPERAAETPLAFMLRVMNDPAADTGTRARMAIAAAPYMHPRAEAPGKKKDAQEAAGRVGKGRLETPATPPRLIVSNQ
jgi:hypothetical protein